MSENYFVDSATVKAPIENHISDPTPVTYEKEYRYENFHKMNIELPEEVIKDMKALATKLDRKQKLVYTGALIGFLKGRIRMPAVIHEKPDPEDTSIKTSVPLTMQVVCPKILKELGKEELRIYDDCRRAKCHYFDQYKGCDLIESK